MAKLLIILLVALVFEAIGVVFLNKGLKELGEREALAATPIPRLIKSGATNPNLLLGVFFEAIFFAGILALMSRGDVSFIWPLTSLGFVLTTLAARFILKEEVSRVRWCGVVLIMFGAAFIAWSEKSRPARSPSSVTAPASAVRE